MSWFPILMYHNVCQSEKESDGLTISISKLERQFQYLKDNNYSTFHFEELEKMKSIPKKSVVITFDDVTENQYFYVIPLLEKFNLKASFFIPFFYIGKTDLWNKDNEFQKEKIMSIDQLKRINTDRVELGYHSYKHRKYDTLSDSEIQTDFLKCREIIEQNNLKIFPALAYPFGNYPRENSRKAHFKELLIENEIKFGLKIGNRLNSFPFKDNFEIKRIDIKGQDGLLTFKIKMKIGKLKLF